MREYRKNDAALVLFVVAIAAMLLIPLPTMVLDLLLVVNISFAVLLLVVGLYLPNALALLAFPSLLLLTTLFRLSLNVASTRLILSQGYAGEVIQAFGTFLIRGEIVVGILIFSIITIVNFIVISKGASRVSEVAARFALESIPGKQMAIDSDLRSGLITAQDAQRRRDDLRKESQLYAAMDGAMRFVQGDAVAGLLIIAVNLLGGLYIGIEHGLTFSEAVQTYSVLSVGDGLVTQIPALLISICAGIVVTRVSSAENSTLGGDVGMQLFSRPTVLFLSAIIVGLLSALPGLPVVPFLAVAALFVLAGVLLVRAENADDSVAASGESRGALSVHSGYRAGDETGRDGRSTVTLVLDSSALFRRYRAANNRYRQYWNELRAEFFETSGARIPELVVRASETLSVSSFQIVIDGVVVEEGAVPTRGVMIETNPSQAAVLGLTVLEEGDHPVSGSRIFWSEVSQDFLGAIESSQIRGFDQIEYVFLRFFSFVRSHPQSFLTLADVHSGLKAIEKRHPGLIADSLDTGKVGVARLTEFVQELVRQGFGARDLEQVIEVVSLFCASEHRNSDDSVSTEELVSFARRLKRRQLLATVRSPRGSLRLIRVDSAIDDLFEDALLPGQGGVSLAIEGPVAQRLQKSLREAVASIQRGGLSPVGVLVRQKSWRALEFFLREMGLQIPVVAVEELEPSYAVEFVGRWSLPEGTVSYGG